MRRQVIIEPFDPAHHRVREPAGVAWKAVFEATDSQPVVVKGVAKSTIYRAAKRLGVRAVVKAVEGVESAWVISVASDSLS